MSEIVDEVITTFPLELRLDTPKPPSAPTLNLVTAFVCKFIKSPGTNGFILVSAGTANTPAYTNPTTLTIGTATTATNVNVVLASTSESHPLLFTPTSGSASGIAVSSNQCCY